jgi:hypothetical protein
MADKELNVGDNLPETGNALSRTELLELTSALISELRAKCMAGRFRSPDTEKLRDSKTRLLLVGIQTYGGLLRDEQIADFERRLAELEARK